MKKISLHPDISMSLTEFKKMFGAQFLHIPKDLRNEAMKKEYNRIMDERKAEEDEKSEEESNESETSTSNEAGEDQDKQ